LATKHDVTLLAFIRSDEEGRYVTHLSQFCERVETCLLPRSSWRDVTALGASLLRRTPFIIARDYVAEMDAKVRQLLATNSYDVVHIDHLQMAQFVPNGGRPVTLLDEHNVEWRIIERVARSESAMGKRIVAAVEWRKLREFEAAACRDADHVLTVTKEDSNTLSALEKDGSDSSQPCKIETIPIGVDTDYFGYSWQPDPEPRSVFVGTMYWPPNVDCVTRYCRDILPLIRKSVPELQFDIVGLRPARAVVELSRRAPGVHVLGSVDDVRPYMSRARVFVVPLYAGSGMRVKILNAMAVGVPVVTTSVGCEGIEGLVTVRKPAHSDANREANIWVADSPEDFSEAVVTLAGDEDLATGLSRNGRKLMLEKYDWGIIRHDVLGLYDRIEADLNRKRAASG
jgi:glycosyltransferase involved in cell wall biosynthesis